MTLTSNQKNMTRIVCFPNGKCANCYYYGAPCLNCIDDLLHPTEEMTYAEYKQTSSTDKTYEEFCKESDECRKKYPYVFMNKNSPIYKEYLNKRINKSVFDDYTRRYDDDNNNYYY